MNGINGRPRKQKIKAEPFNMLGYKKWLQLKTFMDKDK